MKTTRIALFIAASAGLTACELGTVTTDLGTLSLESDGLSDLFIGNDGGRIEVVGDPWVQRVEVTATLHRIEWQSQEETFRELRYDLDRRGDRAFLHARLDEGYGWIDVRVTVPESIRLEIEDTSGHIEVASVSGLRIRDDSGEILARWIHGDAIVEDDSGDLELSQVAGNLRVVDDSGEIRVESTAGDVELVDGSGDLSLRDVAGAVRIQDGSGSIRVEHARARVEIRDGSGDITLIESPNAWVLSNGSGQVFRR